MSDPNILQIIPAPPDMYAIFKNDGTGATFACKTYSRVICLALIQDGSACRQVEPMIAFEEDTETACCTDFDDFAGITFSPSPPDPEPAPAPTPTGRFKTCSEGRD